MTRLALAALLTLLVAASAGLQTAMADEERDPARPAGVDCAGFRYLDGIGPVCPADEGLWEVFDRDGASLGFTHGGDPVPAEDEETAAGEDPGPTTAAYSDPVVGPVCVPYGSYRTVVIYAYAHDDVDRYSSLYYDIQDLVIAANTHLRVEAGKHDVQVDYRIRCNTSGQPAIYKVELPTDKASADFSTIVQDLKNIGWNDPKSKYMIWYDDPGACSCGGTGTLYNDDRLTSANYNNGNTGRASFGVTFGHMSERILMHEHGHNMGAVQNSAPRSTGGYHCIDGQDVMCYNDGGPKGGQYTTRVCTDREWFDCNHDDYFHPDPPAGNYLANHWNLGSTLNRFLEFGDCGLAREGYLTVGTPALLWEGMSASTEAGIDPSCWGRAFILEATAGTLPDIDVGFYDGNGRLIESFATFGDEAGTIPDGAAEARVHLYSGAFAEYILITP